MFRDIGMDITLQSIRKNSALEPTMRRSSWELSKPCFHDSSNSLMTLGHRIRFGVPSNLFSQGLRRLFGT